MTLKSSHFILVALGHCNIRVLISVPIWNNSGRDAFRTQLLYQNEGDLSEKEQEYSILSLWAFKGNP